MIYRRGSIKQFFKGDPTLLRYYDLSTRADLSGKGKNLSVVGNGAKLSGFGGLFDGSGAYSISETITYGDFTNMAWIKTNILGTGTIIESISQIGGGSVNNNIAYIGIVETGHSTYPGRAWYGAYFSNNYDLAGTKRIDDGKWHLIVQVRSGSRHLGYLDGKLDVSGSIPTTGANPGQDSVGYNRYYNVGYFRGWIREVAVFSRVLSPDEISAYYNWAIGARNKSIFIFDVPSVINARRRLLLSTY
jgi:hypothetical protein